jgi:hypothetical protein
MPGSVSTAPPRATLNLARRRLFRAVHIVLLATATILLLEVSLRLLPLFLSEPRASFFSEAARIQLCNSRVYGGNRILLPKVAKADILVVGDSIPFGTYVRASDAFPACLGRLENKTVVNLGVPSQAPPEYNRMLEVGARYRPSLVLYCVFANDFAYANLPAGRELSTACTYTDLADDRRLFLDELSLTDRVRAARKAVANLFLSLQLVSLSRQPLQQVRHLLWRRGDVFYAFADKKFWDIVSYDNPDVRAGLAANAELSHAACQFCRSLGATMLVVLLPSKEMVYGPLVEVGPEIYDVSHDRTYCEFRVRLEKLGVPCVDLTADLRAVAQEGKQLYFSIDGHFNEYGHEMVARLLRKALAGSGPKGARPPLARASGRWSLRSRVGQPFTGRSAVPRTDP